MNPKFENYLMLKLKKDASFKNIKENEKFIYMIINDFIIRPFNLDIFLLEQITKLNTKKDYLGSLTKFKTLKKKFIEWLDNYDYINIALYILKDCKEEELDDIILAYVDYFSDFINNLDKKKIVKEINIFTTKNSQNKRKIILSRILNYYSHLSDLTMGKNIYILAENDYVESYKTINSYYNTNNTNNTNNSFPESENKILPYQVLSYVCEYSIDRNDHLSLFYLKRDDYDIKDAYLNNWLYFASFSSIWRERIEKYNGIINHENKMVEFNEDDFEVFYNNFNYEPDEQTKCVQNKSVQPIEKIRTWESFYKEHSDNCVIIIDHEYLNDLIKIHYL